MQVLRLTHRSRRAWYSHGSTTTNPLHLIERKTNDNNELGPKPKHNTQKQTDRKGLSPKKNPEPSTPTSWDPETNSAQRPWYTSCFVRVMHAGLSHVQWRYTSRFVHLSDCKLCEAVLTYAERPPGCSPDPFSYYTGRAFFDRAFLPICTPPPLSARDRGSCPAAHSRKANGPIGPFHVWPTIPS